MTAAPERLPVARLAAALSENAARLEQAVPALVAIAVSTYFGVPVERVTKKNGDRVSDLGRRAAVARDVAISMMQTGAGWTGDRAAGCFDVSRGKVSQALARAADIRDQDKEIDAFMEQIERALSGLE